MLGALDDVVVAVLGVKLFLSGISGADRRRTEPARDPPGRLCGRSGPRSAHHPRPVRRIGGRLLPATSAPPVASGSATWISAGTCAAGSPRRVPPREGHPDHRCRQAREEGRAQGRGRGLCPQLPDCGDWVRAVPAAGGAYRAWQHDIASREEKRKREREEAEIAANRIGSTTLTMGVKVGEGGKLYGSITTPTSPTRSAVAGSWSTSTRWTWISRSNRWAPTRSPSRSCPG